MGCSSNAIAEADSYRWLGKLKYTLGGLHEMVLKASSSMKVFCDDELVYDGDIFFMSKQPFAIPGRWAYTSRRIEHSVRRRTLAIHTICLDRRRCAGCADT